MAIKNYIYYEYHEIGYISGDFNLTFWQLLKSSV